MSFFKNVKIIIYKPPLGKRDKKMLDFKQEDVKLDFFPPFWNL